MTTSVALLGAGRIARLHAASLQQVHGLELVAVSDPAPGALDSFPGDLARVPDWREAVEMADAVMVCSPSSEHPEQVVWSLGRGRHVFCEKPLATTVAAAEECVAAAENSSSILQVGFHKRYDRSFRRVRDEARGERKLQLRLSVREPRPSPPEYPRWPGGIFLDCLIHEFDLARFLLDEELRVVAAHSAALFDPHAIAAGDGDTAAVILESESGAVVTLGACRQNPDGYQQRVELQTDGSLWTTDDPTEDLVRRAGAGVTRLPQTVDFFVERYRDAYVEQLNAFAAAIAGSSPVQCTGADGLRAIQLALRAAELSGEEVLP